MKRAALRLAGLVALYALVLRAIGAGVGVHAAGVLTVAATLEVALLVPLWLFLFAPSWLAWRVLLPAGLPRAAWLACWLSPLVRARDLPSVRWFLMVATGRAPAAAARDVRADAWTALGAALQAERQGNAPRARLLAEALLALPDDSRVPGLARVHGVEALALAAARRGDWLDVRRWAEIGRGRLVDLLRLLAEAHAGEPVGRGELWRAWALAPLRARTWPLARALARLRAPAISPPPPPAPTATLAERLEPPAAAGSPHLRHLHLLAAAARGEPVAAREVLALTEAWDHELAPAGEAHLRARALELEARRGPDLARDLRDAVVTELVELALLAEGPSPPSPSPLAADLDRRVHQRLLARVESTLAALRPDDARSLSALDAWERWLDLRAAFERLEPRASRAVMASLWYGSVRDTVWSWTYALIDAHGPRAAWGTHAMFAWLAARAELAGDLPASAANQENARVARRLAAA